MLDKEHIIFIKNIFLPPKVLETIIPLCRLPLWPSQDREWSPGKKDHKNGTNNLFNQLKLLSLWLLMGMMT